MSTGLKEKESEGVSFNEISKLIKFIYPDLEDHPNVLKYEKVKGIDKNLFFFNHYHTETENSSL